MSDAAIGVVVLGGMAVLLTSVFLTYAQRLRRVARALRRGERTTGRLVRTAYEKRVSGEGREARHFFAFETADGREVEFEDYSMAVGLAPGDPVTVSYDPADPERSATIANPDEGRLSAIGVPVFAVVVSGLLLLGLALIGAAALGLLG
ncbi:DUF3592 domain-containing protein [Streptomyces sp. NPDC050504]|uniref:DUF3592 domain-containing protein n=1 Tax=Streptomyces sp. NPDC050504 TaxID=3365618 RepID=UPI0037BA75B1